MEKMNKVGAILKKERESRGLSFDEISAVTKIHPRFLQALEEGNYQVFTDIVHIKGFLKNYADFLGLDVPQTLAFWRREYTDSARPTKVKDVTRPLRVPQFVITPGVIVAGLTFLLVTAFLAYLFWQYRSIAGPPVLRVTSPMRDLIVTEPKILIEGATDPLATLEMSGQKINLDEQGHFSMEYILSSGTNTLTFVATNKFGRETRLTRQVVYEAQVTPFVPTPPSPLEATGSGTLP